jgi:uncharacterized protein YfaP (DUF2135 family)
MSTTRIWNRILFCFITAILAFQGKSAAVEKIVISSPFGGWRNTSGETVKYTQKVNYPAASVNTQKDQSKFALIKGKVTGSLKQLDDPFTLIVNGIHMPLKVENGRFNRPYSFGSGSNYVEIRDPSGSIHSNVQFYEAYSGRSEARLRIVLSWEADATDLDLHVVTPDGEHAYYRNRVLKNGGALDIDVTTGYGPEIFSSAAPIDGTYLVYVNYYGSKSEKDMFTATVTSVTEENTLDEKISSVTVPMRKPGELILVHSFVYP